MKKTCQTSSAKKLSLAGEPASSSGQQLSGKNLARSLASHTHLYQQQQQKDCIDQLAQLSSPPKNADKDTASKIIHMTDCASQSHLQSELRSKERLQKFRNTNMTGNVSTTPLQSSAALKPHERFRQKPVSQLQSTDVNLQPKKVSVTTKAAGALKQSSPSKMSGILSHTDTKNFKKNKPRNSVAFNDQPNQEEEEVNSGQGHQSQTPSESILVVFDPNKRDLPSNIGFT